MSKLWVGGFGGGSRECVIFYEVEPQWEENGWWKNGGLWKQACIKEVEKVLGVKIPPYPQLLEVEIKCREVCVWEPRGAT